MGDTEVWEIYNFTADAHPDPSPPGPFRGGRPGKSSTAPPVATVANHWESGYKDTVISYPGEITRVKALFDWRDCTSGTVTSSSTRTTR